MIHKAKLIGVFAMGGLLCADFALADSVVSKDGVLYYTGPDSLTIDLAPGGPSSCPVRTTFTVSGATADSDVVISGIYAFVRTGNNTVSQPVPIPPGCLTDDSHNVGECIADADLDAGTLTIPCVNYQGNIYEVHLEQRGSSSNWEVSSTGINGGFLNYPGRNR